MQNSNCNHGKFFKIPISAFDIACKFSLIWEKCKMVTFLDFDYIITKEVLAYSKESTSKK